MRGAFVQALLDGGASKELRTKEGLTAAHVAKAEGHEAVLKRLETEADKAELED